MLENFKGSYPKALSFPHFPTRQQAFVWRNWEMLPVERLGLTLGTTVENIVDLAEGMGLRVPPKVNERWMERGYLTIIRQNWHLLPFEQLLTLLDWPEEELAYVLKEDDFLYHKLGSLKPDCEPLKYAPLTSEQILETSELKKIVEEHFSISDMTEKEVPFAFLDELQNPQKLEATPKREQLSEDILIDGNWSLVLPENAKRAEIFAKRFIDSHAVRWGENLPISGETGNSSTIELRIEAQSCENSESHSISVANDKVIISSLDEVGLLRGLNWLEKEMISNGGPYLREASLDRPTQFNLRYIYSYFAVYGDPLLNPELDPYPDGLLARLANMGVNGIWLQGILYQLFNWELEPSLSEGYEKRLENLRKLTERAANYGIGVYLYLNEPRCLPLSFFEKHPELKGNEREGNATLCTSVPAVRDFLRQGCVEVFENVPELAGVFTISMSENPTNCYSHHYAKNSKAKCPRCSSRTPAEVVAQVNQIIGESVHSVKPEARVIAWNWAWPEELTTEILGILPENLEFMSTSENLMPTNVGGVVGEVHDYTLSQASPGPRALKEWNIAREKGMKTIAKVQLNNTWEFSAAPYLPVLNRVNDYLSDLSKANVDGLMLSWTLGGYPSLNLDLASRSYWGTGSDPETRLKSLAIENFGESGAPVICEAWRAFSEAFQEFPFSIGVAYNAPMNFGPMDLLFMEPTAYAATMIGFPYDDLDKWRHIYPVDVFESQFEKLTEDWRHGLEILESAEEYVSGHHKDNYSEMARYSVTAYCHFRSTYLQIRFVRLRNELFENQNDTSLKEELRGVVIEEISLAEKLHELMMIDSKVGFEASNHYYYTARDLREKIINCHCVLRALE